MAMGRVAARMLGLAATVALGACAGAVEGDDPGGSGGDTGGGDTGGATGGGTVGSGGAAGGGGTPGGGGGTPGGGGSGGGASGGGGTGGAQTIPGVTFHKDVMPLIQKHCQGCHSPGGIGPFQFMTYDDVKSRMALVNASVATRRMPPWLPSESCQSFVGDRSLSAREIAIFTSWAEAGGPEGPYVAPPAPPARAELPWVDMTIDAGLSYTPKPPAGKGDDYHCFAIDPKLTEDKYLVGYDMSPDQKQEVHHVVLFETTREAAQAADAAEAGPGWTCFGGAGTNPQRILGNWVPGTAAVQHPAGTALRIGAGRMLVLQMHYNVDFVTPTPDRTAVKLQFAKTAPARLADTAAIATTSFRLPPNSTNQSAVATLNIGQNSTLWGVQPHMHVLGRRTRLEIAGGGNTCLIDIPAWNFNWQQLYFYASPSGVSLPAGTQLRLTCVWDNPTARAVNPGEGTTDEMCGAGLYISR